jgi:hypothetical protein
MGSVSRFFSALGGLFLLLLAFGLFGVPIVQTLADPENADFPGGAFGIVIMLLLMASVPVFGAVVLLRRAIRGATPDHSTTDRATEAGRPLPATSRPGSVASTLTPVEAVPAHAEDSQRAAPLPLGAGGVREAEPVSTASAPAVAATIPTSTTTTRTKRTWITMTGLAVALIGVFFELSALGYFASEQGNPVGATLAMLLAALPLWLGLRMARGGDPDLGRGFLKDLGAGRSTLMTRTTLTNLLGTSFGRGVLTVLIGVPLMIAWRELGPLTGPYAMTIFSFVDPLPMAVQAHWWRNAFISGTVWFVLYLIFAATVQILTNQSDAIIGFILPFIAYPAMMALSGAIRFFQWVSPAAAKNQSG